MFRMPVPNSSLEEKLVFFALSLSYVFYLSGTLYIVGSLLGWALLGLLLLRWFVEGRLSPRACVPVGVVVWILGMLIMLVALLVAHADYSLGLGQTIKSSIGWGKGWALLALFPLLGALDIVRPKILIRACCVLSAQAIPFAVLGLMLSVVGFDGGLYTSPLKAIGGPISVFEVGFFGMNPETGKPRWAFLAPWAPAAGLLSCLLFVMCINEKEGFWRRAGIAGTVVMVLLCQSRAGWAIYFGLIPLVVLTRHLNRPGLWLLAATSLSGIVLLGQPVIEQVNDFHRQVKEARPDSTRVRNALATIAVQRWESEAPVWGHGVVEKGPKMVEFMPIGSHHSWYGLLFVKGLVGLLALAIPLLFTVLQLSASVFFHRIAQPALLMILVMIGYSFFENLEILAYLFWPALLWLGYSLNPLIAREEVLIGESV